MDLLFFLTVAHAGDVGVLGSDAVDQRDGRGFPAAAAAALLTTPGRLHRGRWEKIS